MFPHYPIFKCESPSEQPKHELFLKHTFLIRILVHHPRMILVGTILFLNHSFLCQASFIEDLQAVRICFERCR